MFNNVSYRRFQVVGTTTFVFSSVGGTVQTTPAINAARTTDGGDGLVGVAPDDLQKLLLAKEELQLFRPNSRLEGPDVASAEIVQIVERDFGIKRPI